MTEFDWVRVWYFDSGVTYSLFLKIHTAFEASA